MRFRPIFIVAFLLTITPIKLYTDDDSDSAKDIISKVAKNYLNARSLYFECQVKSITYGVSSSFHRITKLKDKNKILFKQVQKISDTQEEYLCVANGSKIFFYNSIVKQYIEQAFTTNPELYKERFNGLFVEYLIVAFYLGYSPKELLAQVYESATWKISNQNEENLSVVSAENIINDESSKKSYTYSFNFYIDKKNLLINKYVLTVKEEDVMVYSASEDYTNYKLNENMDDKEFVFNISEGVKKVESFENVGIERLKLFLGKKLDDYPAVSIDEDKNFKLSDYKDKVVIIDLWDSREQYSQLEIPHLVELCKKYHKDGLEIIGISVEEKETIKKFAQANKIDYKLFAYKKSSDLPQPYSLIEVIPTIFLIDKKNRLRKFYTRSINIAELESEIKILLNE